MKRGLITGFRALLVAVCVLLLATVAGYQIKSGQSVAMFVLFIAGVWILLERILMTAMTRKKAKTRS